MLPDGITAGRGTLCSRSLGVLVLYTRSRSLQGHRQEMPGPRRGPEQPTPGSRLGSWPPQCLAPSAEDDAVLCFCLSQEAILSRNTVVSLKTFLGRGPAYNGNAGLHLRSLTPGTQLQPLTKQVRTAPLHERCGERRRYRCKHNIAHPCHPWVRKADFLNCALTATVWILSAPRKAENANSILSMNIPAALDSFRVTRQFSCHL